MNPFLKSAAALAMGTAFIAATPEAEACTSFLVGKKASADGSAFITYNADDYGMYGMLRYYPAAKHPKGTMRRIVDGDTNEYRCDIPEAPETYAVIGNINEYQLAITETTFGGRPELDGKGQGIDYVSLMTLGLQRAKTAREAIKVMTTLVNEYGYAGSGESFSIADPNEVWILELIGKGSNKEGAVWVAVRIPDDCIAVHANQSRIHQFDLKDKKNVLYAKDVIKFAREKGYFSGKDEDFSFADAYAPADFSNTRFCEARAWSFFNRWVEGMDRYLPYADGHHIGEAEVMPLYFRPKQKLTLHDVMMSNRDHYEGTPFDVTKDAGAGLYNSPYRPTPLVWEHEGVEYFNERPISTQQSGFTVVAQVRDNLPDAVGGVLWYGNDDPNMVAYTPVYCSSTRVPKCYSGKHGDPVTFSWESAFWVCNWVANMTYPRYSQLFPSVEAKRDELERGYLAHQASFEKEMAALYASQPKAAIERLTAYSSDCAAKMLQQWRALGEYLIVKFNDMTIKPEKDGKFTYTKDGLGSTPERPGYTKEAKETIIRTTGDKFRMPK
ncbi:peptidase, family c69 [gut metagenome]|uniref:Peptidase, family c69 n=1 Tax=gut metagenome TaxID=749906 RepID=J9F5N5_9ZZZZ